MKIKKQNRVGVFFLSLLLLISSKKESGESMLSFLINNNEYVLYQSYYDFEFSHYDSSLNLSFYEYSQSDTSVAIGIRDNMIKFKNIIISNLDQKDLPNLLGNLKKRGFAIDERNRELKNKNGKFLDFTYLDRTKRLLIMPRFEGSPSEKR